MVKYALRKVGVETGGVRLPLTGFDGNDDTFDKVWESYRENLHIYN